MQTNAMLPESFAKKMYFTKLYKFGKLKGAFQKSKSETARLDYSK